MTTEEARLNLAANLQAVMHARDWNIADVGVLIDVTPSTVLAWIEAQEFPCPRHFARLAMISGKTRDELLCPS